MPRPVCEDSEEEEEVLYDPRQSQRSTFSWAVRHAEAVLADAEPLAAIEGPDDAGPGSTASSVLLGQIHDAQRGLFATASSTSPAAESLQRRRTTIGRSQSTQSPPPSAKRSTSPALKTDGSESVSKSLEMTDQDAFAAFRNDDAPQGPIGCGTMQRHFISHEPNILFRDTGETVAFNASAEQRALEQARNENFLLIPDVPSAHGNASDKDENSSFPWSASAGPTQTSNSNKSNARQAIGSSNSPQDTSRLNLYDETQVSGPTMTVQSPSPLAMTELNEDICTRDALEETIEVRRRPKSSPVVEIPRYDGVATFANASSEAAQEANRGRKRKSRNADEDEDQLNSDDRQIGLPKEQYKPRPSRRRATGVVEQNIDFSVVPEKAAKKRRKTADASLPAEAVLAEHGTEKNSVKTPSFHEKGVHKNLSPDFTIPSKGGASRTPSQSSDTVNRGESEDSMKQLRRETSSPLNSPVKTTSSVSLMAPPPLPPPSSKKKGLRSKTTIFEDHITSPTLSQQQAMRKSAVEKSPSQYFSSNRRKRRSIVQDDDEEEDELARASPPSDKVAPKKRGRPPKNVRNAKSTQRVVEDSEDDDDGEPCSNQEDEDNMEQSEQELEPPTKKAGRGRPRKAKPNEQRIQLGPAPQSTKTPESQISSTSSSESAVNEQVQRLSESATDEQVQSPNVRTAMQHKDANIQPQIAHPAEKLAQPVNETPLPAPAPAKPSPASHSPLKSSSLVPLRVGLSKKRKIPSLLKNFRPPPKQSTR